MQILGTPLSDLPPFHISSSPPLFTESAISERNYKHVDISSSIFFSGDITKYHTGNVLTERVILTRPESRKKKFQKPTKNINCSIFPLWRKKCVAVTLQNQFLSISFFLKTSELPTQNGWPQHGPNCSHYVKSK